MIAFVDESCRRGVTSLGFFVCRGDFLPAWSTLRQCHQELSKAYGLRINLTELKFSDVVRALFENGVAHDARDLVEILAFIVRRLSVWGVMLAVVLREGFVCLSPEDREFIEGLISRRREVLHRVAEEMKTKVLFHPSLRLTRILSALLTASRVVRVTAYILDRALVKVREVEFLNACLRALGITVRVRLPRDKDELGVQVADFVAGYARYVAQVESRPALSLHVRDRLHVFSGLS